jgi:RHS repeat-associated protein
MLDHDYSSDTDHAQFRQYSSTPGRWMSPDPYYGSYDQSNPQSMDRYAYVSSSPLTFTDPSGLGPCLTVTYQWVAGPAQSNGGHGDEGTTVASYLCDGFSGGSGTGSASAPNNQQKSQKRQQCEVAAQQQYDQSNQNIQNSFLPNLKQSAVSGAIHGAIVGCVAGAVGGGAAGSVVGPEGTLAVAAVGCASLAPDIAAITAVSEATFSLGHSLWDAGAAYFTYKQQMNACSAF